MRGALKTGVSGTLAVVLVGGVLSLYRLGVAAPPEPPAGQTALRNPIAQRDAMIRELQEIKALLKEQNALLQKIVDAR